MSGRKSNEQLRKEREQAEWSRRRGGDYHQLELFGLSDVYDPYAFEDMNEQDCE